jgi:hypothetical protein
VEPAGRAAVLREAAASDEGLWLDASGASMVPTIRAGDRIHVVAGAAPHPGEVWAVSTAAGVVVHRCVRADGRGVALRGDAHLRADPVVPPERVIGRVDRTEPDRAAVVVTQPMWLWRVRCLPRALVGGVSRRLGR